MPIFMAMPNVVPRASLDDDADWAHWSISDPSISGCFDASDRTSKMRLGVAQ